MGEEKTNDSDKMYVVIRKVTDSGEVPVSISELEADAENSKNKKSEIRKDLETVIAQLENLEPKVYRMGAVLNELAKDYKQKVEDYFPITIHISEHQQDST